MWYADYENKKGGASYMSDYIIETHDLTKKYGNQNSVSHLNIHVKRVVSMDFWDAMVRARQRQCGCCWD